MAKATEPFIKDPRDQQSVWFFGRIVLIFEGCLTFARWVMNLQSEYKWRSERYRSRLQLLALSDHELRDIGITREDAIEEAKRDFWD